MLCLSRKKGESIVIGNGIVLTVLKLRGNVVKLGIEAPREIPICRKDGPTKLQRLMDLKKRAATVAAD